MENNRTFLEKLLDGAEVEWRTLGEVSELRNTGVDKKINESEKSVRLLNFTDVFNNQYLSNSTPTMIVTASDKKIIDCNILKGDLFITPTSEILDEIGQSAVALENIDNAVYSYHIMRIRIHDTNFLLPEFLNYLFRTSQIKQQIRKNAQGITRFGLTLPRWKSLVIPIPPLSVQTEIVKILDALTALTSELTSELTLRRKQYEYYREKLLSFDSLEQLNMGGAKKKLIDVAIYAKVRILADKLDKENYVGVENLLQNKLGKTSSNYVPTDGAFIEYLPNDILIGNIRPYLRKIWLSDRKGGTNGDVLVIRLTDENILPRYLYHILANEHFFEYNIKYSKGAKMPRGDKSAILQYEFDVPPLEQQQRIVSILDKFETLTNSITDGLPLAIEQSQKRYEYYRELLLNFE